MTFGPNKGRNGVVSKPSSLIKGFEFEFLLDVESPFCWASM